MAKVGRGHIFRIFSSVTLIVLLSKVVGFVKQMVTASAFAEDIAVITATEMDAHISKPIDMAILCQTLKKLLTL